MTPVERALLVVGSVLFTFAVSWATDREGRRYRRPILAAVCDAASTVACVYGAHEKGAGSWWGLLCAAGALYGAWLTVRAVGEWLERAKETER